MDATGCEKVGSGELFTAFPDLSVLFLFFYRMVLGSGISSGDRSPFYQPWHAVRTVASDLWEYTFQIQGRVSLIGLLIFGTGGLTIVYWIAPRFNQWLGKKEGRNEEIIAFLLLALFLIDVCYSILHPNQGAGITAPAGAVLAMRP